MTLRLVWVPEGQWSNRQGFVVAVQEAPWEQGQCAVLTTWHKYVPPPTPGESELLTLSEADEPAPLPADTQFLLVLTHDNGEPDSSQEAFYDWHALDFEGAQRFCQQEYGQGLEPMAHAARELIGLPQGSAAH